MSRARRVLPQCLALVLCDTVIEDIRTRNKSLINMFNGVLTPSLPARQDKLCAFAAFTGGRGDVPISLRIALDRDWEKDLLRLGGSIEFPTNAPHTVVDLVFEIRGFVFPEYGGYSFEVLADETPLAIRRFHVSPPPATGQGEGEGEAPPEDLQ